MKNEAYAAKAFLALAMLVYPQVAPAYVQGHLDMYQRTEDKRVSRPRKDPIGSNTDITSHIETDTDSLTIGCNDTITYAIHIENSGLREKTNVYANLGRDTYLIKASHGPRTSSREIRWKDLYIKREGTTIIYVTVGLRPSFRFDETKFTVEVEDDKSTKITKVKTNSLLCKKNLVSSNTVYLADARADILYPTDNQPGNIITSLTADRSETQPGSSIIYSYTIQNTTEISLTDLKVEFSIPRELARITETSAGIKQESSVQIEIPRLLGGKDYTGTIRVQTDRRLEHGQRIPAILQITDSFGNKKITSQKDVSILQNLPQTGSIFQRSITGSLTIVNRSSPQKHYLVYYIVIFSFILTISGLRYYSKKQK